MKKLALIFCLSFFHIYTNAQPEKTKPDTQTAGFETIEAIEDTLGLLAYLIVNDSLDENRLLAVKTFIPTLVKALKVENSFDYPFERLINISIKYPADSTFRIFTWQLYVNENDYRYFGAIQMNSPELQLFPLKDRSFNVSNPEQDILTADNWYGSVYYNLTQFESQEGRKYLLFGYDGYSFFNKRKVVDVLSFKDNKPIFGAPVFVSNNEMHPFESKNRLLLTYSAEASVKLNYDGHLQMIIFDHLINATNSAGQTASLPDGSYEAFQLKNGQWQYLTKVFDQVSEKPPREQPIFDDDNRKKKDIFGKNQ